jgi:hypothetical protein
MGSEQEFDGTGFIGFYERQVPGSGDSRKRPNRSGANPSRGFKGIQRAEPPNGRRPRNRLLPTALGNRCAPVAAMGSREGQGIRIAREERTAPEGKKGPYLHRMKKFQWRQVRHCTTEKTAYTSGRRRFQQSVGQSDH